VQQTQSSGRTSPPTSWTWRKVGGSELGTVRPTGDLDLATGPRLAAIIDEAFASVTVLVVDLRAVTFIDVMGAHVIVAAGETAARRGRRLIVVRAEGCVDGVFAMTGLDRRVQVVDLDRDASADHALLVSALVTTGGTDATPSSPAAVSRGSRMFVRAVSERIDRRREERLWSHLAYVAPSRWPLDGTPGW
jgi:anti-anti-sigma factor